MMRKVNLKENNIMSPWLLSEEVLSKIDSLMEKAYCDFNTLVKDRPYITKKKLLTIWFKDGTEENFQSFREAMVSFNNSNQNPVKFEYVSEVSLNRINIKLDATKYDCFGYYINCEDVNINNNLCYDMQQIYFNEKPKWFFSVASLIRGYSFLFYFLIFLATFAIMILQLEDPFKNTKERIHQILLNENLQQEDYLEIIKYSTIINYNFTDLAIPNNQSNLTKQFSNILNNYIIIGLILCLIITATPKPFFAIGKGKKRVAFWKCYYRFLLIFLPIGVLLPILINLISYLITKYIN
jgi:hypothetical protein